MKSGILISGIMAVLSLSAGELFAREQEPKRSGGKLNVVLIVIDTLRADHMGCYGCKADTTPRIDKLAKEGFLFERCYSTSSWTLPACVSLLTGLYSDTHGVKQWRSVVPKYLQVLPEILRSHGYHCAGVSSNPFLTARQGFGRGFDIFDDTTVLAAAEWSFPLAGSKYRSIVLASTGATTTRRAIELLNEAPKGKPLFLFAHYMDPHADYVPPPPFDRKFDPHYGGQITGHVQSRRFDTKIAKRDLEHVTSLYRGEIAYTDRQVGQLLDHLAALGLDKNTCVIVTADHGEEFLEHGNWGHGHTLFEECVRVPLIVWLPGRVPSGKRSGELVSLVDVAPTVLAMLGIDPPKVWQGVDLNGIITGGGRLKDRTIVLETSLANPLRAVIQGRMKLICSGSPGADAGEDVTAGAPALLFDQSENPRDDLSNTIKSAQQRMEMLTRYNNVMAELNRAAQELFQKHAGRELKPDEKLMRQLKSLGYIGQ